MSNTEQSAVTDSPTTTTSPVQEQSECKESQSDEGVNQRGKFDSTAPSSESADKGRSQSHSSISGVNEGLETLDINDGTITTGTQAQNTRESMSSKEQGQSRAGEDVSQNGILDSTAPSSEMRRSQSNSSISEEETETTDILNGTMNTGTQAQFTGRKRARAMSLYGAIPSNKFGPKASLLAKKDNIITVQDPGSQRLNWYKPPLTVLIIKKIYDEAVIGPFMKLTSWLLKEKQMIVFVEANVVDDPLLHSHPDFSEIRNKLCTFKQGENLTGKIDLIVSLGGDGTLLYASSLFQASLPPVMAFHLGSLGFLSPFDFGPDFKETVTEVLEGNVPLILRTRLKCAVCRKSSASTLDESNRQQILMLNELVVDRGPSAFLCNIDLYIENRYITSVQGDGVIFATATGSTAYSAATGASMVHPNVPAIIITPICAHSLSFRPIVVPGGVEIKVMVSPDARHTAWVSFDGRNRQELFKGDVLRISSSIYPLPSICSEDQISDWFSSLAGCLHWNVRKQQKAFSSPAPKSEPESKEETNGGV